MFLMRKARFCALMVLLVGSPLFSYADQVKQYRLPHNEICFEFGEYKVECGNFRISSTIASRKYRITSPGADVVSSLSATNHPGDHPFLRRLAERLGYVDKSSDSVTNKPLWDWQQLSAEEKSNLVERYSSIAATKELKGALYSYLNMCVDYWVDPAAIHDKRMEAPTLAEVSALCIADSGVLDVSSAITLPSSGR